MPAFPAAWPPWLVISAAVSVAAVALWLLAKAMRWILWLVLIAVFLACAVVAARMFLR